jgi:DNA invertase Pin-like site-specific DNA recombinase
MHQQFVIYTRVSTAEQKRSGLGLEAQRRDVDIFLANYAPGGEVLGEFCDQGSGADDGRPQLEKALALVRKTGAELLVAKLDRLSRRVSQISQLMEDSRIKFRVASMPHADAFQLHIYAALAQQERDFISKRTIAALAAAKARGTKLGGYRVNARQAATAAKQAQADHRAAKLIRLVRPLRASGATLQAIATQLQEMAVATPNGGNWTPMAVSRVLQRGNRTNQK